MDSCVPCLKRRCRSCTSPQERGSARARLYSLAWQGWPGSPRPWLCPLGHQAWRGETNPRKISEWEQSLRRSRTPDEGKLIRVFPHSLALNVSERAPNVDLGAHPADHLVGELRG